MLILKERVSKILKYSQIIFYLIFLFLWFKDNFPAFKKISISYLFALIPLLIITVIRIFIKFRKKKIGFRIKFDKVFFTIVALILLTTAVRLPFLIHNFGLLNSDDAVSALVAKHISEGKLPPVYHYGQEYLGTFAYHIYGLMFKIFGYSIFILVFSYFVFFLGFIITQFFFFRDIFSSYNLSLVLSLFYCLPIGHLLEVSFMVGSNSSLFLFLGSLSIYFSFLIYKKNKEHLIPLVGFCLGLSFWTRPISICFAITSFIFIALKFKFILRKYFKLMIYFLIGIFPIILHEIFYSFSTFKFVFSGRKYQGISWEKIKKIIGLMKYLISAENNFLNFICLFLVFVGILVIVLLSFKKKRFLPENIYAIFFVISIAVFAFSRFPVDLFGIRHLYPLYFALPFLMVSGFNLLRKKFKYITMLTLFLILLIFNNIRDTYASYLLVKQAHFNLRKIINAMELTGERYWAGDFWQILLITGLSGEKLIGWSYTLEDYFPYRLGYFNQGDNNNYVFFKEVGSYAVKFKEVLPHITENLDRLLNMANNFVSFLDMLDIKAKKEKIGDCWLIYDASSTIFPSVIEAPLPQKIPELKLDRIKSSKGHLILFFRNKEKSEISGFRMSVEIPHYSSVVRRFSLDREEIRVKIPFPMKKSFKINYCLDYMGLKIQSTSQRVSYSPSVKELRRRKKKIERISYLSGFGHEFNINGKQMRICQKEVKFEINRFPGKKLRARLHLFSPFQFSHPYWYGEYFQQVKIYVNHQYLMEKRLEDGENVIDLKINAPYLKKRGNIITLKFKYHLHFRFAHLWKASAFLDKVEID